MQIPGLVIEHAVDQAADGLRRRFVGSGGSSDELAKTIDAELLAARGSCRDDAVGVEHDAITRLERRFRSTPLRSAPSSSGNHERDPRPLPAVTTTCSTR